MIVGIDAHKATHTLAVIDERGRKISHTTVPATSAGHSKAIAWVRREFGPDVLWAVEDIRHLTARLERDLIDAGITVYRVPAQLMARVRGSKHVAGKSDPIDSLAVARALLQHPDLPHARHNRASREAKLLVDRRDDIVRQRVALTSRLLWRVHDLDPACAITGHQLAWKRSQIALRQRLENMSGLVAELALDELGAVTELSLEINRMDWRIERHVRNIAPSLLELHGCGVLMTAKIVGEAADVSRFQTEAEFARYCGTGPLPRWSGSCNDGMRRHRSGNRQLNAALHRIALIQIRDKVSAGSTYYAGRIALGDSPAMARRCLKRHLARVVYRRLQADNRLLHDDGSPHSFTPAREGAI